MRFDFDHDGAEGRGTCRWSGGCWIELKGMLGGELEAHAFAWTKETLMNP